MICKKCQKRIKKDTPVCPYCGTPQTETVSLGTMGGADAKKKKKPLPVGRKVLGGLVFLLPVVAFAVAFVLEWHWMTMVQMSLVALGLATCLAGLLLSRNWKSVLRIVLTVVGLVLLLAGAFFRPLCQWGIELYLDSVRGGSESTDHLLNPDDVGANTALPTTGVINIALFGLDNRSDSDDGRSDAIMIVSVDRDHNKIKLTSIARDTLANVKDYGWNDNARDDDWTKLTHAFYYGAHSSDETKTGPSVAVRALNENFNLNITKYAFVNFHEFAKVIDLVGGVEITVEERELYQMNKHIRGMISGSGLDIEEVTHAGTQTLSGGQALAYARLRKVDSDIKRGNRQKAVIDAVLKKAKASDISTCLDLLEQALQLVNTNLTNKELSELAMWLLEESPETVNFSIPDDDGSLYTWDSYSNKSSTTFQRHGSVYVMDLDYVSAYLRDFIYETNEADPTQARKLSYPEMPAHLLEMLEGQPADSGQ